MTITVSSVGNVPAKKSVSANESKGKTIGTVVGAGAGIAYNVKNHEANFGWAIEKHVKAGNGTKARAIACTVVAGIVAASAGIGRFIGGLAGNAVDKK